jgi:hypothetical protein
MRTLILLPVLALAACNGGDGNGTTISINANDSNGAFAATADKDGRIAIDAPGFKGAFKLPSIKLDAGNFDLHGVKLPPGSVISAMDIQGGDGDKGGLTLRFRSPLGAKAVQDWFAPKLAKAGYALTGAGNVLSGKTDEGKPFSLTVTPTTPGASEGMITIGE